MNPHTAKLIALIHAMATVVQHQGVQCTVHYDATSAAAIADGQATSKAQHKLMHALFAMRYAAAHLCQHVSFEHVEAHKGHPWNEAADTAAKAAAKYNAFHCPGRERLAKAVREGELNWLWLTITPQCHAGVLPGLDDEGSTLDHAGVRPCQHSLAHIPGIPAALVDARTPCAGHAKWSIRAATYNCTTLTKECDRQCLATCFAKDRLHIIGLQESRTDPGVKRIQGPYTCFCSPAEGGNLGCQLWVKHNEALAHLEDGQVATFDVGRAAVQIREPRLLVVVIPAGAQLFACVVAHAPVADTHPAEAAAWWRHLDSACRRVPRNAIPLILLDANARFHPTEAGHTARDGIPKGPNGHALQAFVHEHQMETARSKDSLHQPVITWWSPQGFPAQIDDVVFPAEFANSATTDGIPAHFVDPVGFDHKPLQVTLEWEAAATGSAPKVSWDRAKMRSPEGRQRLASIFNTAPTIQWDVHPDDHIQQLNDHIYSGLSCHFQRPPQRPRQHHVSDELWQTVRSRRQARRNKDIRRRLLQQLAFAFWKCVRNVTAYTRNAASLGTAWHKRRHALAIANARLGIVIRRLSQLVGSLDQRDAARYTQQVLKESRHAGPAAMATALRGVLKQGRRYKAPRVAPVLHIAEDEIADPADVQDALELHFAAPEHGCRATVAKVAQIGHQTAAPPAVIEADHLPCLAQLTEAFLKLKPGKAAGLSSFPAELYSQAPLEAAAAHMPVLLKSAASGLWPVLWKGSKAVALPKPGKMPSSLTAWRSIALYDTAAKGIGKALRQQLTQALQRVAAPGQHGALPGDTLAEPANGVQAYLAAAAKRHTWAAVLFLDGKAAYYSVVRQCLLSHVLQDDVTFLQDLFGRLRFTPEQQTALLATFQGAGALERADVPTTLRDFLRSSLQGTWFTMSDGERFSTLIHTKSGTVPGTPLADCLFSFAQADFQRAVQHDIAEAGLGAKLGHHKPAPLPSWADDVSVMLPFCAARDVAPALITITRIVEHHSRAMGVELNFDRGKTEALCAFRGVGSKAVRRELLHGEHPAISVPLMSGLEVHLRLVESYVHLGSVVCHSSSPIGDIRAKASAASPCLERLRRTLLRNTELGEKEKVELVRSLIIAKVSYGAALWSPRTQQEASACSAAFGNIWRSVFRTITGLSTLYLDDDAICAALHVPAPEQFLCIERIRQLGVVVKHGPSFLWQCLIADGTWLATAFAALETAQKVCGITVQPPHPTDLAASLVWLRDKLPLLQALPGKYSRAIKVNHDGARVRAAAKDRTEREKQGWLPVTLNLAPRSVEFACSHCNATFSTKAALASHKSSRHKISLVCDAVSGSACPVCRQEWWTTFRLKEHLRRSRTCRTAWNEADLPTAGEFEHTGHRAHKAWKPPTPISGPQPFWATLCPEDNSQQDAHDTDAAIRPTASAIEALAVQPAKVDLARWFTRVYTMWTEHAAAFAEPPFVAGTVAHDAWLLCSQLSATTVGATVTNGSLQILLEERNKLWLTCQR